MAATTPPDTTINVDLVRGYLARIDLAVANIRQEVAGLPQRAASAGRELVACISRTATLRDDCGDLTRLPNGTVQDIETLARVLEEVLGKVKHLTSISKKYRLWESPEAKIEKYRKRADEAILRLSHLTSSSTASEPQSSASPQASSSLNISPLPQDSGPIPPAAPTWAKTIGPARSTLKVVSAVTPIIPVVGQFIQCGVDVGNGLIDMFDGMSQDDEKAVALAERVSRLSKLVAVFQDTTKTYATSEPLIKCLGGFQTQCDAIQKEVDSLKSQAGPGKFTFSQQNAGILSRLNSKIDEALKAMSMYLQLNTEHVQRIQERDRLRDRLGDGYFGDLRNSATEGLCSENTRVEVLERIDAWTRDPSSESVLWIKGQAGRGKSTIARTAMSRFAEGWKGRGSSAIFHFRRGDEVSNKRVISALVRQIARGEDERVKDVILQAIRDHQDVARSPIKEQFKWLLIEPLQKLGDESPPILFVIDALDECSDRDLIRTLLRLVQDHSPSLPYVKFLITSRPEHHIINAFSDLLRRSEDLDTGDLEGSAIQDDLRAYYMDRLGKMKGLEPQWQSADVVDKLVDRSERLFQWANTVMKYVEESPVPRISLRRIIEDDINVRGLDRLYNEILSAAFPSDWCENTASLSLLQHILGSLAVSPHPISLSILRYLWSDSTNPRKCAQDEKFIHGDVLARLSSMLIIPGLDFPDAEIRFVHTSVRDFLTKKTEATVERVFVDAAEHHTRLAKTCFQRMKRDLLPGICNFQLPSQTNDDVRELVKERISPGLKYCCRSWSAHLSGVEHDVSPNGCTAMHGLLDGFCQKQLLNWLEVLGLTGVWSEAITMAEQSRGWLILRKETCARNKESNTSSLLYDVRMFSVQFRQAISLSARHISRSAMAYCPRDTELWHRYRPSFGAMPRVIRGPISQAWPETIWIGRSHSDCVMSVAFSPDGMMLASGSRDNAICIWNPASGTPIGEPLKGHSGFATSVAFSPDGAMLASGSHDNTVRIWNAASGTPIGEPLKGHSGFVTSIAFSPDGMMLASGSHDSTIRIWNTASGTPIGEPLKGHSKMVTSVAFSPDGTILASGSLGSIIRIWNIASSTPISEPLQGHSRPVTSVTFSPDRTMLASGSLDSTIRIWNTASGTPIGERLEGHSDGVTSVAFLPSGTMLASGSHDNTIRIWNATSGTLIGEPLQGHSRPVTSMAFSPDRTMLASGSLDSTIRIWNTASGTPIGERLEGHSDGTTSVAFFPDGTMLAPGSHDNTTRGWQTLSGMSVGEPLEGHSGSVTSVAFSPDETMLASGSHDKTIRIWNTTSGTPIGEPLKGHSDEVTSVAFSPDRATLFSESWNGEKMTWNMPQTDHIAPDIQLPKSPSSTSKMRLYGQDDRDGRMGWVFRDDVPWFWMPEEFFMDGGGTREISFSGNTIAITHQNIHMLDVSAIM